MGKLVVWGTGERSATCFEKNLYGENEIIAFVDSMPKSEIFFGYKVFTPEKIKDLGYDYILVNTEYYMEIIMQLCGLGVSLDKVIITDNITKEPYKSCFIKAKEIVPQICDNNKQIVTRMIRSNEKDHLDEKSMFFAGGDAVKEYEEDYYRYRTFELVASQLIKENTEGEIAELGVFRGSFSALINKWFPNKRIFLFDTFEGFNEAESKSEIERGNCDEEFISPYKDTSVERVIKRLPYPEEAIVCQGFFPETVTDEARKSKYAFVSLDVDFYESTLEGLRFFYPRLSQGGFIFLHDYNTSYLSGVGAAVETYERELEKSGERLIKIPIADRAGTLIITK